VTDLAKESTASASLFICRQMTRFISIFIHHNHNKV